MNTLELEKRKINALERIANALEEYNKIRRCR